MPYFSNNNKEEKILLIHIPKTGGSSIEKYFSEKYNIPKLQKENLYDWYYRINDINDCSLQHLTYTQIEDHQDILNNELNVNINLNDPNLKIIATVRNPYERLISDLFWFKKINENSTKEEIESVIRDFYLNSKNRREIDYHHRPQIRYVMSKDSRLISKIIIIKTEELSKKMRDIGYTDFGHWENYCREKKKRNIKDYFNKNSLKLVNDYYRSDFKVFNYDMMDPDSLE